jgi:hypothetical protein
MAMSVETTSAPRARNGKLSSPPRALTLDAPSLKAPEPPSDPAPTPTPLVRGSVWSGGGGNEVRLNFINQSNDANNSEIVVFSKNTNGLAELPVAWQVIRNCGQGWNHPFVYPLAVSVGVSDSDGNFSPTLPAENGQLFAVERGPSGDRLTLTGQATSPAEVQILNSLNQGAVNALIFRAGKPYAIKTAVAPGQMAAFAFKPTIWIGVVSQIEEGDVINTAVMSQINTEISLFGIASADIVMTGGGPGRSSTPFMFTLQNIVMV